MRHGDDGRGSAQTQVFIRDGLARWHATRSCGERDAREGDFAYRCPLDAAYRSPLVPWSVWFKACDIRLPEPREGAQFNDVGLMLDAAAAGFGVTLTRLKLAAGWLDSGRLVRLSPRSVASPFHHFLCWKPGTLDRWECVAFVDWLTAALQPPTGA